MQGLESLTSEIGKRFKPASPNPSLPPTTGAFWGMSGALQWFSLVVWFFCLFLFGGGWLFVWFWFWFGGGFLLLLVGRLVWF